MKIRSLFILEREYFVFKIIHRSRGTNYGQKELWRENEDRRDMMKMGVAVFGKMSRTPIYLSGWSVNRE